MKLKNLCLSGLILLVLILSILIPSSVKAAQGGPLYLGISEIRTNDTPEFGYAIGDPYTNGVDG